MSDTNDTGNSSGNGRKPLTVSRGSSGTVRQSFSHGRSKQVVVEKKKRRMVGAPGKPGAANSGGSKQKAAPSEDALLARKLGITEAELQARKAALQAQKAKQQERAAETQKVQEAQDRLAQEQQKKVQEDKEREEAEARRRAAEEEAKAAEEAAQAAATARSGKTERAKPDSSGVDAQPDQASLEALGGRVKRDREKDDYSNRGNTSKPRGEPKRRKGKLTIASALGDDTDRQRSLASLKRSRERERERRQGGAAEKEKVSREVQLPETITLGELANRMKERVADVVKYMMQEGEMMRSNDIIDADTAELITAEFGHTVKRVSESDVEIGLLGEEDAVEDMKPRAPIVTVMGHVDHGKTSLLDAMRKTDVVSGEAGGITQHIGAYQVQLASDDKITVLDTPGHAAFSSMRARGANVTDIVILVVAADDGVMPQTQEAIAHAKAAGAPIIVAVNKIDKPDAKAESVLTQLLQYDVQVEAMGGEVQAVSVSALTGEGLDKLTEAITLQAELLELAANPDRPADGVVVESQLDKGRGPVATVLVKRGSLKRGDIVVAGQQWGKVRALVNERGQQMKTATPSLPAEVLGLDGAPDPGELFVVVDTEARAREITEYRQRQKRQTQGRAGAAARASLETLLTRLKDGSVETSELPVVVKGDVQGSVEAISQSLEKISTEEVRAHVIHGAVGGISESDILLAQTSGAPIFAFNVRANKQARELAEKEGVEIRYYSVIYDLIDDVKNTLSGMLAPEKRESFLGYAEILEVFNITKVGKVSGCRITEGVVKRGCGVRLLRDDVVIHEGNLKTLKRFKDEVAEVSNGQECGMAFEKYDDMRVGDRIECFQVEEIERRLD